MNKDEMNRAIAEACGWKVENYGPQGYETIYWRLRRPDGSIREDGCTGEEWSRSVFSHMTPDYASCLNAMAEAKDALLRDNEECRIYIETLADIVTRDICEKGPDWKRRISCNYHVTNGSAPQQAEALLRTLNLYQDTRES